MSTGRRGILCMRPVIRWGMTVSLKAIKGGQVHNSSMAKVSAGLKGCVPLKLKHCSGDSGPVRRTTQMDTELRTCLCITANNQPWERSRQFLLWNRFIDVHSYLQEGSAGVTPQRHGTRSTQGKSWYHREACFTCQCLPGSNTDTTS